MLPETNVGYKAFSLPAGLSCQGFVGKWLLAFSSNSLNIVFFNK